MWAALALTTAALSLAPAQNELKLTNVRATYGVLGPERKDTKLLPGDVLVVAFDIEGLAVKEDGRVLYAMGMELTMKGAAKPEFKQDSQDLVAVNTLGGSTLPAFALAAIGTDSKPGEYTLKVTIKDRSANKTVTLNRTFEVVKKQLGFVRVRLTYSSAEPAPPLAVPGQRMLMNCSLVGFEIDKKSRLPHVAFEMVVYDSNGKPTLKKPFAGDIKTEVKETEGMMTFLPIPLELNRPGKYKITIRATDKLVKGAKPVEQSIEIDVQGK